LGLHQGFAGTQCEGELDFITRCVLRFLAMSIMCVCVCVFLKYFLSFLLSKFEAIHDGCEISGLRMFEMEVIFKILKTNHHFYKSMEFEIVEN
jgi:hypothetical protein